MDTPIINCLSLCSGSGQLDIAVATALELHGVTARTVGYSEREAASCAVLRSRMEDKALESAPIWGGNLEDFPAAQFHGLVDAIVAGFPCQPHSVAGARKGRDDERNLLPAILDIADTVGATALFLENVAGLKREFPYIVAQLLQRGWQLEWGTLRASEVGAAHRRERWFCVAYREYIASRPECRVEPWWWSLAQTADRAVPGAQGDRLLGDSDSELHDRAGDTGQGRRAESANASLDMADSHNPGRERPRPAEPEGRVCDALASGGGYRLPVFAPGPESPEWGRILDAAPWLAPALPDGALRLIGDRMVSGTQVASFPTIFRMANGLVPILDVSEPTHQITDAAPKATHEILQSLPEDYDSKANQREDGGLQCLQAQEVLRPSVLCSRPGETRGSIAAPLQNQEVCTTAPQGGMRDVQSHTQAKHPPQGQELEKQRSVESPDAVCSVPYDPASQAGRPYHPEARRDVQESQGARCLHRHPVQGMLGGSGVDVSPITESGMGSSDLESNERSNSDCHESVTKNRERPAQETRHTAAKREASIETFRADMLRIVGNGVVPQQAAWAFYQLLTRIKT